MGGAPTAQLGHHLHVVMDEEQPRIDLLRHAAPLAEVASLRIAEVGPRAEAGQGVEDRGVVVVLGRAEPGGREHAAAERGVVDLGARATKGEGECVHPKERHRLATRQRPLQTLDDLPKGPVRRVAPHDEVLVGRVDQRHPATGGAQGREAVRVRVGLGAVGMLQRQGLQRVREGGRPVLVVRDSAAMPGVVARPRVQDLREGAVHVVDLRVLKPKVA
mmetsp:Transcript_89763/g.238478  ORF Transcript_89763/g.238478 Transcript_89763/m.238478 type:complete len:218 (+) Transcript_89763:62-715(+)